MQTISMIVKYDGSAYFGWQRQQNQISVQGVLEAKLKSVLKQSIIIHGSGRTDAKVHAMGQCFSFEANLTMPIDNLKMVLNRCLPNDIVIISARIHEAPFHARYQALGKTYVYKIYTDALRDPFKDKYTFHVPYDLNLNLIEQAIPNFLGEHDFKVFMASGSQTTNTVRTIYKLEMHQANDAITFTITGNGFLYKMVRSIVGTLIQVGRGKISPNEITTIILTGNRQRVKYTAGANGLYLNQVYYHIEDLDKNT